MIEISPNEKYLITYSKEDGSIVGWNVEDLDKVQLKFDQTVEINDDYKCGIESLCVSDDKKFAYIYSYSYIINIIDMNNKDIKITLSFDEKVYQLYCTFNLRGEFILYSVASNSIINEKYKIIWIYSTHTKNNKWECKRFYEILKDYELISISKYDKVYLFSNDCICEWDINTEKNIQFYNFMNHTGLFLLPSLFYYTPDNEIKYCWNSKYKNMFNQTLFDEPTDEPTDESTDEQTKFVLGILNKRVWQSKFYENMSKTKVIECDYDDKKTYNHLNIHSFNPYMDTVSTLFEKVTHDTKKKLIELIENLIKWEIYSDRDNIRIEVFKKINTEWELISTRIENHPYKSKYLNSHKLIMSSLFNNNDIVILTTFELIRPQPSPFTKSINRNIYKTWNGEALINFKWNTYGKYYYAMIWILFMTLLGCFTAAATIPQQYINEEVRQQLFIASIILGFIHLIFEIRQFFYNITKWFYNFWNIFDIIAYVLSIYTSIYWLQTNDRNNNKAFEYFGVYFAIIISVGKKIFSFLLVIFIIIISFAHAFYILLSPKSEFSLEQYTNNNDPNNPWNLAPSYSQIIDNNGNINSNPFMIQPPDKNTNMFIDIRTSLFAIYLFLAEDNNRVSYLIQKAEILAEIELFYLLPHQRRWHTWFPEVIHYYADADKTRIEIERLIKEGEWDNKEFIKMQEKLLEELQIKHNPIDNKVILDKLSALEKLEKIEKIDEKLEKLDKLEKLEKSYCENLDKLKKLDEIEKLLKEMQAK
ncbi:hypothetical protein RhiirA4_548838 [Rhizophagus irregularis]|uniref:Ion transport domain-containing protein n=1 Tax=Rhizophagus irregularis TaxID=588596 RepID=A0A2I1H9T1_9GLOM|nr:hypothetical protein RhiirA4_548838 [Rhizophagus irregularis]